MVRQTASPVQGKRRYTGVASEDTSFAPPSVLTTTYLDITYSGCPFKRNKVRSRSSSSSNFEGEHNRRARSTRLRTRLILYDLAVNESQTMYKPVNVGFRYTDVITLPIPDFSTRTSKKDNLLADSNSQVNFSDGCSLFNNSRNSCASLRD